MPVHKATINLEYHTKPYPVVMPSFFQYLSWGPLRMAMKLCCAFEIRGIANIDKLKGGVIIASNHISELDPLLISACFPFFSRHLPLFYVSREKDFYKKGWRSKIYGGIFFRLMGAYPAYVGLKDYGQSLRHHLKIIEQGKDVVIFPTGKKISERNEVKARGGVAFLAWRTRAPIIPVFIQGIENFSFVAFLSGKRKLTITFGKPLIPESIFRRDGEPVVDGTRNDYEEAASVLMQKIFQLA